MENDYDDSKPNPIKKEFSISSTGEERWLNEDVAEFIYKLSKETELTAFTGNVTKKDTDKGKEYRFETFIYKDANYGRKYDSKEIFLEKQKMFDNFLNNIKEHFWDKGWRHGDLNPSNYVIYYTDQKPKFKIFDFEHTTKYGKDLNTVGYLKFLWNEEIRLLYFKYANYMEFGIENGGIWKIGNSLENLYQDKLSKLLYKLFKYNDEKHININEYLNYIINHLKSNVFINNVLN